MRVISWNQLVTSGVSTETAYSLTVGVFDGVHRGHQRLLSVAAESGPVCVVTFGRNPQYLLDGKGFLGDICTIDQKLELLERYGVSCVVLVDFDAAFRALSGKDFLDEIRRSVQLSAITVGTDFRCGRNLDTSAEAVAAHMARYGIRVDIVAPLSDNGQSVSSTRVRGAIRRGDFDGVRRMLGHPFMLDLRKAPGYYVGGSYRIPRASLSQVHPAEGVYSGRFVSAESGRCRAIDMAVLPDYIEVNRACRCDLLEFLNRKATPVA